MTTLSSYSLANLGQYALLVALFFCTGMAIGHVQKAFRKRLGGNLPQWSQALSRFLLQLYTIGMVGYSIFFLVTIYEKVDLPLLLLLTFSQFLLAFVFPCTACSVVERRPIFPWTFFSPNFYSRDPNNGGKV